MRRPVLVDTSVWVAHLRNAQGQLALLLEEGSVLLHPFVLGELALGNLTQRSLILALLRNLPIAVVADQDEVLRFIELQSLYGKGLGYVDVHLLAAAALSGAWLWTEDKKLASAAAALGVDFRSVNAEQCPYPGKTT